MANIGSYPLNEIITGDSRLLAPSLPDGCLDLIFTDPVYPNKEDYLWLASVALRTLKPAGVLLCWSNGKWHRENANWLESVGLKYRYDFACVHHAGASPMNGKIISKTNRVLWFDISGESKPKSYIVDGYLSKPWQGMKEHKWTKNPRFTNQMILAFSPLGGLVADFFCGGGTIPSQSKASGRDFIASEIEVETAEQARKRLLQTRYSPTFAKPNTAWSGLFDGIGEMPAVVNDQQSSEPA